MTNSALSPSQILFVDDDKATCDYLLNALNQPGWSFHSAKNLRTAEALIKEFPISVVISDIRLGDSSGLSLLQSIHALSRPCAIIYLTGFGSVDSAVKAIREGAFDYITKPLNLEELVEELKGKIQRALAHVEHLSKVQQPETVAINGSSQLLIGKSHSMGEIYKLIARAALSSVNVLITGESGTGKELVAKAIHKNSRRNSHPFITVNCCALTETLLESELFGHIKGSFTGATLNKRGLFEEANGGTLFLDEIGDISAALQVKLLRAVQEGEIKPVGAAETRKVDVRIIAATHRNLLEYLEAGKFREDLYYRLRVLMISIPPLRDRKRDIPEIVNHLLAQSTSRNDKRVLSVSPQAMDLLKSYSWPGNIRELENAIEQAVAITSAEVLFPEDFPTQMQWVAETETTPKVHLENTPPEVTEVPLATPSIADLEKRHIEKVLQQTNFNKSKAAEILGVDRVTLYRKASRFGISLHREVVPESIDKQTSSP